MACASGEGDEVDLQVGGCEVWQREVQWEEVVFGDVADAEQAGGGHGW